MKRVQKAALAGVSALALGLGTVAVAPVAESHVRGIGTASTTETVRIARQAVQQDCLTVREVRKIAHGNGTLTVVGGTKLTYAGSIRSGIDKVIVSFVGGCTTGVSFTLR